MQLHSSCFLVSPGWSSSSHLQPSSQSCSHDPPLPYRPLGGPLCIAPSLPMPYSADSSHLSYATLCSLLLCLTFRLCVNFNTVVRKSSPGRGLPFSFPLKDNSLWAACCLSTACKQLLQIFLPHFIVVHS